MAFDTNKTFIKGRLVRDVELGYTANNKPYLNFSVANNPGKKEAKANFFDCKAWNETATNLAKFLKKGDLVFIEGILSQNTWQDKEGKNRSKVEIVAFKVDLLRRAGDRAGNQADAPAAQPADGNLGVPDNLIDGGSVSEYNEVDEVPF